MVIDQNKLVRLYKRAMREQTKKNIHDKDQLRVNKVLKTMWQVADEVCAEYAPLEVMKEIEAKSIWMHSMMMWRVANEHADMDEYIIAAANMQFLDMLKSVMTEYMQAA